MNNNFSSQTEIFIHATPAKVWDALTNPELIKQYLFGTQAKSDWKVGSPITYTGIWNGKTYEDKGVILESEPEKILVTTYWSSMSKLPDAPENYQTVSYKLDPESNGTKLTIGQTNAISQQSADDSSGNWKMVLEGMKKILEG